MPFLAVISEYGVKLKAFAIRIAGGSQSSSGSSDVILEEPIRRDGVSVRAGLERHLDPRREQLALIKWCEEYLGLGHLGLEAHPDKD